LLRKNFFYAGNDSQNDASLEPLWGSHFGYRDADERKALADVVRKFFFVIGSCEASLRGTSLIRIPLSAIVGLRKEVQEENSSK